MISKNAIDWDGSSALGALDLAAIKIVPPEALQQQSVSAVLLALGSNYQAQYYLPQVRKKLATLGQIQLSTPFQNSDFTATLEQPKPDYTNQCVYLVLTENMTLSELQQTFKKFEVDCGRQRASEVTEKNSIKIVPMDIDILLIKPSTNKNSLSKNSINRYNNKNGEEWVIMANRYPFKAHEIIGLEELTLIEY
ncbi:2-amino-4-hydroxy-6-hydroxymethyldihydropteridine diphosphokinase [Psychrobacter jeotgali]|uniref:2-amino-4-hydroxy-6- hydroxymethyldihydropteridine diphosphokinase n=1 Tax=Psychrobacter jeotgali TaxID=179010 RepID=UPI00191ACF48|nr:2-amino-4-hydroxy-6-hydroxymethyldihydropteridine diphosphokinase [Psychrobacter jeotgali]